MKRHAHRQPDDLLRGQPSVPKSSDRITLDSIAGEEMLHHDFVQTLLRRDRREGVVCAAEIDPPEAGHFGQRAHSVGCDGLSAS